MTLVFGPAVMKTFLQKNKAILSTPWHHAARRWWLAAVAGMRYHYNI
jgi:hypothetical protein